MPADAIALRGVDKRFDGQAALRGIDLSFDPAGYTCVMGPSGSGKTTLLRLVAGFEQPDAGDVCLGERSLALEPPERRPFHSVLQAGVLFPYLDVVDNVAFAGRVAGVSVSERRARAASLLDEVGLDPARFGPRDPATLSGGEAQRVALARALYGEPAYLLLDEPLSAVDRDRRADLRRKLRQLQRSRGCGFLHVTHDPQEAMFLADDLVVLIEGRVRAQGAPADLYRAPPDLEVARLLGELTAVPGGWARPEALAVRTDDSGRVAATERGRAWHGSGWELELDVDDVPGSVIVHVGALPDGPVRSLYWEDDAVLSLPR